MASDDIVSFLMQSLREKIEPFNTQDVKLRNEKSQDERSQNERLRGERPQNKTLQNERSQNEKSQNERSQNERSQNEISQNERFRNEISHNERSQNEMLQNERLRNERSQNEKLQNEILQNERLQNEISQNERSQNERLQNKRSQSNIGDSDFTITNDIADFLLQSLSKNIINETEKVVYESCASTSHEIEPSRGKCAEFNFLDDKNLVSEKVAVVEKREEKNVNVKKSETSNRELNNFGAEIKKSMKVRDKSLAETADFQKSSWKTSVTSRTTELSVPHRSQNVEDSSYTDPTFGLRIINPLISSQALQSKMVGRVAVPIRRIHEHLSNGDKNADWVFAGVICVKGLVKTSQKGSKYCMWKITDLKGEMKQISLFLFSKASTDLWKLAQGTVIAVLNASPFQNREESSSNDVAIMVRHPDQVMVLGTSKDMAICRGKKKSGENCTMIVNRNECEFCVYHVKSEYRKFSGKRSELQSPFSTLRNKILGRNEVFYGGKSFTATKPARTSNKQRSKDARIINTLSSGSLHSAASLSNLKSPLQEQNKFATNEIATNKFATNEIATNKFATNEIATNKSTTPKLRTETSLRIEKLREANEKIAKTGKAVDIFISSTDLLKPVKDTYVTFSDVFGPKDSKDTKDSKDLTLGPENIVPRKSNKLKKIETANTVPRVASKIGKPTLKFGKTELARENPVIISNSNRSNVNKTNENKYTPPVSEFPAKENNITKNIKSVKSEFLKEKCELINNGPMVDFSITLPSSNSRALSSQELFKKSRVTNAKARAISILNSKGGVAAQNDKKSELKKRKIDEVLEEETSCDKKGGLSKRFIELMNATSQHSELIEHAEDMERHEYFNKMEMKEKLEEKMLSTFKVACKAVKCLTCKYTWFSGSDLCKSEGHQIKVTDAFKRFFKCSNCTNRTISLDIFPLVPCKNCGSTSWSRAPMMKEKIVKDTHQLSIRGDEQKFVHSTGSTLSLDLLVPE